MKIVNNFGGIDKEIYNIGDILHKVGKNYLRELPIVCNEDGEDFEDYRIYGSAGGVGDEVPNLWNEDYTGITASITYVPISVSDGAYTMSTNTPLGTGGCSLFLLPGNVSSGATTAIYGVYSGRDRTVTAIDGYITVAYRIYDNINPQNYQTMLNAGNVALPYGYEVDMSVKSGNFFDKEAFVSTVMKQRCTASSTQTGFSLTATGTDPYIGTVYSVGASVPSQDRPALIKVMPNTKYTLSASRLKNGYISYIDNSFTSISFTQITTDITSVTVTTPANTSYLFLRFGKADAQSGDVVNFDNVVINRGESASYQPYYITTPIYIGSSPLEEDEYIDYESGKIYRKKQVHTDTITIDGIEWDILGYDHDTVYKSDNTLAQHSVTIQAHDVLSDMQFDAKEALFAFDNGLAAGTYHFTVGQQPWYSGDVGKTIQFTLAQALPAGGQLVVNNAHNATMIGATISVFESGTATTATETVTMSEGSDGIDLGTVNNAGNFVNGINSIQRALFGSNRWSTSAFRQYLNSDAAAGSVWTPQTVFDRPPSWAASAAGFLNGVDSDFMAVLGNVQKRTALSTVCDGGGVETTTEKVFLLSQSEVYGGDIVTGGEGSPYPYYSEYSDLPSARAGADSNRIKYRNGTAKYLWLRSPNPETAHNVRIVDQSGAISTNTAAYSSSVAPACCIPLDDIETNDWLREKFLKPVDPPTPLPSIPTVNGKTTVSYAGTGTVPEKAWFSGMEFEIEDVYFGDKHIFSVWGEYEDVLPAQFNANGNNLANYRIYGSAGGVGDVTENLFNAKIEQGSFLPTTGAENPSDYRVRSKFEDNVISAGTYIINAAGAERVVVYVYDTTKNFVSGQSVTAWQSLPFTFTINDAYYVRFAFSYRDDSAIALTDVYNIMLTPGSTAPASYVPYGYEVDMSITGNIYNPEATDPNNGYIPGYYMQATGEPVVNSAWHITEYIPIDPTKKYVVDYAQQGYYTGMAFYDSQKNYLSGQGYMGQKPSTLTVPQNAVYARFSIINPTYYQSPSIEESETTPIYIGSSPLNAYEYIDYASGKIIRRTDNLVPPSPAFETTDRGITISTDGDGVYRISGTAESSVQIELPTPQFSEPLSVAEGGNGAMNFFNAPMNGVVVRMEYDNNDVREIELSSSYESAAYLYVGNIVQNVYVKITGGQTLNGTFALMVTDTGSIPQTYDPYVAPVDPPVPLPALPTVDGTNIVDYAGQSTAVPSQFYAKYRKQNF